MTDKPICPLSEKEERKLMDHKESYASQFDSDAEWQNEVAQFGDASFARPKIHPLVYEGDMKIIKDKAEKWAKELQEWENEQWNSGDFPEEWIPF